MGGLERAPQAPRLVGAAAAPPLSKRMHGVSACSFTSGGTTAGDCSVPEVSRSREEKRHSEHTRVCLEPAVRTRRVAVGNMDHAVTGVDGGVVGDEERGSDAA